MGQNYNIFLFYILLSKNRIFCHTIFLYKTFHLCFNNKKQKGGFLTLYEQIISEQKRLEKELQSIDEQLKQYPEGNLVCTRNKSQIKWYNNSKYLPKSERKLAEKLAAKKYHLQKKQDLLHQLNSIQCYLSQYSKKSLRAEELLSDTSNYFELLSNYFTPDSKELIEWAKEPYKRNPQNPENLVHKTISGEYVRSKSEVLIATVLHMNNIPFRYECPLTLNGRVVYPDFTIRHPKTGELFYWEHFGKMDDFTYRQKTWWKMEHYTSCGILPTKQLILTYETAEYPLSITQVEQIVKNYFLN